MSLVVDERATLHGQPGCHALIVGVSAYPHLPQGNQPPTPHSFGMKQLSSAALTGYKIYQWLLERRNNLPVPLTTCRLLLSPSQTELAAQPELLNLGAPATLDNFLLAAHEWRKDACTHSNNYTFFYFAGHGVQASTNETVILLSGFGSGIGGTLRHAVEINNLFDGMAVSGTFPTMARTQWYFVDACRNLPSKFKHFEPMNATPLFDVERTGGNDRTALIFYAAIPGSKAYALRGQQTVFSKALLHCLRHAVELPQHEDEQGNAKWPVTVHSLEKALDTYFQGLDRTQKGDQEFILSGLVRNAVLDFLSTPPLVDVVLRFEPIEVLPFVHVQVTNEQNQLVWDLQPPLTPHPYLGKLPAGLYRLKAVFEPSNPYQFTNIVKLYQAKQPRQIWKVRPTTGALRRVKS